MSNCERCRVCDCDLVDEDAGICLDCAGRMARPVTWWARGSGVARMGPYHSQVEASAALMGTDGHHVDGAFVWPEYVEESK